MRGRSPQTPAAGRVRRSIPAAPPGMRRSGTMSTPKARLSNPQRLARLLGVAAVCIAGTCAAQASASDDGREILTIDHYVAHVSTVPAMAGETAQLYVRERVAAGTLARAAALEDRVV